MPLFAPFWRYFHFRFYRISHITVLEDTPNARQESQIVKLTKRPKNHQKSKTNKKSAIFGLFCPWLCQKIHFFGYVFLIYKQGQNKLQNLRSIRLKNYGPKFGGLTNYDWIATLPQQNKQTLMDFDVANSGHILKKSYMI